MHVLYCVHKELILGVREVIFALFFFACWLVVGLNIILDP